MLTMTLDFEPTEEDFIDVMTLRSQLVNIDEKTLIEYYSGYKEYLMLLNATLVLMSEDSAFLLFRDSFSKKLEKLVNLYRYNKNNDSNIKKSINEIILYLNGIDMCSSEYKRLLKTQYQMYHEEIRKTKYKNENEFIYALGHDAFVYAALVNDDMEIITQDDMYLSSINYLLETIPFIFEDEYIRELALKRIDNLGKGINPFKREIRKYSQETKENFQKIIKKGE